MPEPHKSDLLVANSISALILLSVEAPKFKPPTLAPQPRCTMGQSRAEPAGQATQQGVSIFHRLGGQISEGSQ